MKLVTLNLENFQGIRSMQLTFGGKSATILGDNATGKTTVFNAITWLLFDKAGSGAKGFTPKTKGACGDLHNLEHSAEATFLDKGRLLTLKKVFHEVYKKKRGGAIEEFDGHTVDYFIDGVPVKEKEYSAAVLAACGGDPEFSKLLTMPDYFSEGIPWESRRRILLSVCGDISDEEVIDSTPDLRDLPRILLMPGTQDRRYTVDDYRKVAAARRTEINRRLSAIPLLIAEAERAIPDVGPVSREEILRTISDLEVEQNRLRTDRATAATGNTATADLRKRMAEVECTKAELRSKHVTEQAHLNNALNTEIREARNELMQAERDAAEVASDLSIARKKVAQMKADRERLLAEYNEVAAEAWNEEKAICPTCHRPLPEDDVYHMREQFNLRKSRRLEAINARGRAMASQSMIDEAEATIAELEEALNKLPEQRCEIIAKIDALEAQKISPVPFEETNGYYAYEMELAALREKLADCEKYVAAAVEKIDTKLSACSNEIRAMNERLALFTVREAQTARITELEREEKQLAAEFEEIEMGLYLCDLFIRTKVKALTEHVESAFRTVRFRLFREQINGGLAEDCEVMIPTEDGRMIPYAFANTAARINAGLEIISVLSHHFDVEMPIVVDNAESVTRLAEVNAQVIRLVVSEADKQLRLELN